MRPAIAVGRYHIASMQVLSVVELVASIFGLLLQADAHPDPSFELEDLYMD